MIVETFSLSIILLVHRQICLLVSLKTWAWTCVLINNMRQTIESSCTIYIYYRLSVGLPVVLLTDNGQSYSMY